jgi:hypothetical protein
MEITVRHRGDEAADIWVSLTEEEADGVATALRSRLQGETGFEGPGYRFHLDGGNDSELTIAVLDRE